MCPGWRSIDVPGHPMPWNGVVAPAPSPLTIVFGGNGAGKSSVFDAVFFVLGQVGRELTACFHVAVSCVAAACSVVARNSMGLAKKSMHFVWASKKLEVPALKVTSLGPTMGKNCQSSAGNTSSDGCGVKNISP